MQVRQERGDKLTKLAVWVVLLWRVLTDMRRKNIWVLGKG